MGCSDTSGPGPLDEPTAGLDPEARTAMWQEIARLSGGEGLPGVRDLRVSGRNISARSDDGAAAVPGILAALDRAGAPAAAVTVARPSLDDVYLRHTGRRYSAGLPAGTAQEANQS